MTRDSHHPGRGCEWVQCTGGLLGSEATRVHAPPGAYRDGIQGPRQTDTSELSSAGFGEEEGTGV